MSGPRERRFRRLLRWFPAGWRAQWEQVVLGTLQDDADARGLEAVPTAEAWRLGTHGVVERIAAARARLAVAALVTSAVGAVGFLVFVGQVALPAVHTVALAFTGLIGPVLLAAALAGAAYRAGLLTVRGTGVAILCGAVALVGGYLAALSWAAGIDEADAGIARSPFASAFPALFAGSWAFGTAALTVLLLGVFRPVSLTLLRVLLSLGLGGTGAFALGITLVQPTTTPLAAAVTAIVMVALGSSSPRAQAGSAGPAWPRPVQLTLVFTTLLVSGVAAVFAFTGVHWPGFTGDGTRAMNIGLMVGALGSIPLLLAAGSLLRTRAPYRGSSAPAAATLTVMLSAAMQWTGSGSTWQAPLFLAAAAAAGCTVALLVVPLLRLRGASRIGITVALAAAAGATLGMVIAAFAPLAAPIAAAVFVVLTTRRARRVSVVPSSA